MLKLKAPLIIAGTTCVLSMLIGLISGVRFLSILGRGLIAGVGAGSFVLCVRMLLERFIPDLFTSLSPSEAADAADISSGSNINITLDDDLGTPAAASRSKTEYADSSEFAETADAPRSTESAYVGEKSNNSGKDTMQEDAEDAALSDLPLDGGIKDGVLSDLPNMGLFVETDDDFNGDDGVQTDSSGFSMSGIQTDSTDSKVMAQAIRTVLATED